MGASRTVLLPILRSFKKDETRQTRMRMGQPQQAVTNDEERRDVTAISEKEKRNAKSEKRQLATTPG